jgi:hypothetical protein
MDCIKVRLCLLRNEVSRFDWRETLERLFGAGMGRYIRRFREREPRLVDVRSRVFRLSNIV